MSSSTIKEIKKGKSRPFRRIYVKRRLATTGLFETTWQDISRDVKKWGKIQRSIDNVRYSKVKFSDLQVTMTNDEGKYNPHDDESSFWFGYAHQQRTLVKVETGFIHQTQAASGVWTNTEYPATATAFVGLISGDFFVSDANQVTFPCKPLLQVFRDFPARNLTGWTSTGMTASQFITMVRDQTDGAGAHIFRPFFGDTTTNWEYTSTGVVYTFLNTSTSKDVIDKSVWDVIEKLSEAEDQIAYVTPDGKFRFSDREPNQATTTSVAFKFFGAGFVDREYGNTIKRMSRYGKKLSGYYSRVEVKWIDSDTSTAIRVREASLTVSGVNDAWNLGLRTFKFENFWIPTSTVADTILTNIFDNVSSLKAEVEFSTSFVPHLNVLDRVEISYDSAEKGVTTRWDLQNWADSTAPTDDLYWDASTGDAIRLVSTQFKLTSVDVDLDNFQTTFIGTEL